MKLLYYIKVFFILDLMFPVRMPKLRLGGKMVFILPKLQLVQKPFQSVISIQKELKLVKIVFELIKIKYYLEVGLQ